MPADEHDINTEAQPPAGRYCFVCHGPMSGEADDEALCRRCRGAEQAIDEGGTQ